MSTEIEQFQKLLSERYTYVPVHGLLTLLLGWVKGELDYEQLTVEQIDGKLVELEAQGNDWQQQQQRELLQRKERTRNLEAYFKMRAVKAKAQRPVT